MFSNLNKKIFNISYKALRTVAALVVAALITTSHLILSDFVLKDNKVYAAFNKQINYQGKLTNSSGVAVSNGSYIMKFRLYTTATSATTTNIWEEIRTATGDKATVTNGLFSVMLGSSTAFTGIDFNQTLYLGVEVCGTAGLSGCDNEMSPRKILGAVPAAFVADTLDGLSSEQFLRTDAVNSTSTASNFLTITQIGAGNVAEFYGTAAVTPAFSILSNGKIGVGSSTPFAQFSASTTNSIAAIFDQRGSSDILQLQKSGFNLFNFTSTGRLGIGSTSPYAALAVAGEIVADIFTSTSTTATSTFANHISIATGKEFRINGVGILTMSGTAIIGGDLTGNTRGAGALDIQGLRTAATQVASGATSTAIGSRNTASAASTTAVGIGNTVSQNIGSAFGYNNSVTTGSGSTASGYSNTVTGSNSVAFGKFNTVSGTYSSGSGYRNQALGINSSSFGNRNIVQAFNSSSAFGMLNLTSASSTSAFGFSNIASAVSASAFGQNITNNIATSTMIGPSDAAKLTILGGTGAVGYVGVGTSTPHARLTVWGAGTGTGILANFANNASTTVFTALDNGNVGIGSSSPFAKLSVAGNSLGTGIIFALSTSTASATNTAFVIDANGKVGIGTTSPSSQLAISGGWFTTASSTGMNGINLTNGCFAINGTCVGGAAGGSGTVSSGLTGQTAFYNADGTTVSGTSTIFTSTASKVGIGSTTPWAKLGVGSFGGTAPQFVVASSTGSSATSTDFIIDQFGNVGVGTTSPWAKFSVAGQAVADYFTAVSTTATSTFAYDAAVTGVLRVGQSSGAVVIGNVTGNVRGSSAIDVQSSHSAATTVASGVTSSAFGYNNTASATQSSASGYLNNATADYAIAYGHTNTASGQYASAIGGGNTASAYRSSAIGKGNIAASASGATAIGMTNTSAGAYASAFGYLNIVTGVQTSAFGAANKSYSLNATVLGNRNYTGGASTGLGAVAVGLLNNQTGGTLDYTTAVISGTATGTATVGRLSGAFGIKNTSSGNYGQAFGYQNTASAAGASVFGSDITNATASSTMIGPSDAAKLTILGGTGAVGYVGVGTSTPHARLTVWGAGTGTGILANFANNASTTVFTALDNGNVGIGSSSPFAKFGVAGNSLGTGIIFAVSTSTASATNTAFVIDANGKVGIGTTSPSSQLAISGGWFTTASSTGMNGINLTNGCFAINGTCVGGSGGGGTVTGSGVANQIAFWSGASAIAGGTDFLFNSATGRMSLGATTTPFGQLSINTSAGTSSLVIGSSTGTHFIVDKNGSVGIGTTSPFGILSVQYTDSVGAGKGLVVHNTANASSRILISSSQDNPSTLQLGKNGLSRWGVRKTGDIAETGSDNIGSDFQLESFTDAGTHLQYPMRIMRTNGNVGLSTQTPYARLSVFGAGTGTDQVFELSDFASTTIARFLDNGTGYFAGNIGIGTSTPYAKLSVWGAGTDTGILANFANNASTSVFTLLDNGNLGLGTTSPYARLSVVGQVVADYFTATSTTATSTFAWGIQANLLNIVSTAASSTIAGGLRITGGGLAITTLANCNGASVLETDSAGVVTCGADSGGAGITGSGTAGQVSFWDSSSSQAGSTDFKFGATTGRMSLGATTTPFGQLSINTSAGTSSLVIGSSTGTHFIVDQFGNVGIGTSSPFTRLSVNGQAAADYFTAVSTTATSTFAYDVAITGTLKLAQGNGSVVIGDVTGSPRGTNALDIQSGRPFGATKVASGNYSVAFGFNNSASGNYSTASGYRNISAGASSFAVGYQNTTSGQYGFALGVNNTTGAAIGSTASGYRNSSTGQYAAAVGSLNTIGLSSNYSSIFGMANIISDGISSSTAVGGANTVSANYAQAFGYGITNSTASSTMIGPNESSKLTILGATGYEGRVGIGSTSPYAKLSVIGGGNNGIFPSFIVGTTSTVSAAQHPLFYVTATTTGALDYARVSIGTTTTPYGVNSGLRDQFTVAGRIYQTWRYLSCDVPGASLIGTFNADTIGACGDFGFDEDAVATFTPGNDNALPYARLKGSDTPALTEAGAIRTNTSIGAASSSPVMEVVARQFSGLATSTVTYIGFTNEAHAGNYVQATAHTNAIVFAASSTNNWQAIVRKNGAETRVDTGVASTSSGLPFNRFRIEASSTTVLYLINGAVVASINSATSNNIPNSNLFFSVSTGIYNTGLVGVDREMDISQIRVWVDDPPTGVPSLAQEESGGGIASFDPSDYDAISGAAISTSYLQNSEGTIEEGTLLSMGDIPAMLKISETPYDSKLFGVVSGATANITLGEENEHTVRVATAGRVLVNVSGENGDVYPGDFLTSSSEPGIAMKATGSGHVLGRALQEYVGATTTGKILVAVQPTHYGGGALTVTSSGNVGIGTTTPNMKLDVLGDVGANGFAVHANKNLMKDIALLGDTDYQGYLDKIRNININTYRYNTDAAEVPTRLGLLADQAPSEVLSITGDVDVYKLATFTLAGVKAQQLKIDSLDQRLTTLEELVANGGFATTTATSTLPIVSYFESLGAKISQDLASFKNVIVETLTVGSAEKPTGITLYDDVTGLPYCLKISNGQPKSEAGKCESGNPKAPIVTPPTTPPVETNSSSTPPTPTEPSTPSEPVVDTPPKVEAPPVETPTVEVPPAEAPAPAPAPAPPPPADAPTE